MQYERSEDTYLEDVDELVVGDVAVLVLIEVVEDDAKLLSRQEDSQLRHELLEFKLLQDAVLVAIEALKKHRETWSIANNSNLRRSRKTNKAISPH